MLVKMCILRVRSELRSTHRDRQGHEIHQKQGRLRDRCRSSTISFGSSQALCQEQDRTNVKTLPSWRPLKCQWTSLPSADASRSDTVPEVKVEQAVGSESEEPVSVRPLRAPWEPTKEEQDIHETSGHAQTRAWCSSCLAGAGRDTAHVRVERPHERAIPVFAADYCFMGERDDGDANARCMPILVMQFDVGTWMHSHAVPNKGTRHPWGGREVGGCDGSKRLSKDHPEKQTMNQQCWSSSEQYAWPERNSNRGGFGGMKRVRQSDQ